MNYRIRIFSNFCDSKQCKEVYERLCQTHLIKNYGEYKQVYITNDDNYTHAIIMNTDMPNLTIPKENVIGFAFEPPQFLRLTGTFIEYAQKHIGKYFLGEKFNLPSPFTEHYSYMWHNPPLTIKPIKKNIMSIVISTKMSAPGHIYRHEIVKRILESTLPIDIYGNGCSLYKNDIRIKGGFNELEPYESYDFHICIENFQTKEYMSEKIVNALLCGSTPIYLGALNVDNFFPDNVIKLRNKIDTDMKLITRICNNPGEYRKNIDVDLVKDKINIIKQFPYMLS
uniref:Fucosyltransferase C-terminal domain-containing protein n=1 Tax=viral metagenome TaxID=1070528 RepID=A0A6C0E453_9ZZZZ